MKFYFVYTTVPSVEEARKIGAALVRERLAACANILPGMQSIYHWQGKIEHGEECVLILKTKGSLYVDLEERLRQLHPFEVPGIVALPIKEGSKAFLNWIMAETL